MPQFVALLRGIGPGNPALRNDNLAAALVDAGMTEVRPVLASGNLVFAAKTGSAAAIEAKIERALAQRVGRPLMAIVRSQDDINALLKEDRFKGAEHGKEWYLIVTFFKDRRPPVWTKLKRADLDGPQMMTDLARSYGDEITTRTWATIQKIAAKMEAKSPGKK
jgi:uncharacterized protein (DUF1697 family)